MAEATVPKAEQNKDAILGCAILDAIVEIDLPCSRPEEVASRAQHILRCQERARESLPDGACVILLYKSCNVVFERDALQESEPTT